MNTVAWPGLAECDAGAMMLCFPYVQLQPLGPESTLSCSLLSHSVSSHLDSSPDSSDAGADIPLSRTGRTAALALCLLSSS